MLENRPLSGASPSPLTCHQLKGAFEQLQAAGVPSDGTWSITDAEGRHWTFPLLHEMQIGAAVEQLRRYGADPREVA
jgi:hypothetical protein